jgi:hypothetical protein
MTLVMILGGALIALIIVVILWKVLVAALKLGIALILIVAIVWGGVMILRELGVPVPSLNSVVNTAKTAVQSI